MHHSSTKRADLRSRYGSKGIARRQGARSQRDGIITADLESQAVTLYRRGELKPVDVGVSTVKVAADLVRTAASAGLDLATRRYQTTHDLLIQKFSASVRDNTPAPVPPEDGRESIRVLDLLMEDLEKDAVRS